MEVALGRDGGASWGFGEDAITEDEGGPFVDWRTFGETRGLTDKQVGRPLQSPSPQRRSMQLTACRLLP